MAIQYAAELVTVNSAQLASWHGSALVDALTLRGPCPVCGHDAPNEIPCQISALERVTPPVAETLTTDLACTCSENHPGRLAGVSTGCGRSWFAVVTIAADGTVALAPVPAQPDPRLVAAAQALRTAGPRATRRRAQRGREMDRRDHGAVRPVRAGGRRHLAVDPDRSRRRVASGHRGRRGRLGRPGGTGDLPDLPGRLRLAGDPSRHQ